MKESIKTKRKIKRLKLQAKKHEKLFHEFKRMRERANITLPRT